MKKSEILKNNVYTFFRKVADSQGEDVELIDSLLDDFDFEALHYAIRHFAQPVLRYSLCSDIPHCEDYHGARLVEADGCSLWGSHNWTLMVNDCLTIDHFNEIWFLADMSIIFAAGCEVDNRDYEFCTEYREAIDENVFLAENDIDLEDLAQTLSQFSEFCI